METLYNLLLIIIMFVAMWFILIRPAQKRQKATQEMQNNLKRGDKVVTIGGFTEKSSLWKIQWFIFL